MQQLGSSRNGAFARVIADAVAAYEDDDGDSSTDDERRRRLYSGRGEGMRQQAEDYKMLHAVGNSIRRSENKAAAPRSRGLTRDTRATVEQVLDERTLLFLAKLRKWNVYTHLYGCVSTGKEANIYVGLLDLGSPADESDEFSGRATADARENLASAANSRSSDIGVLVARAVKVFKTSILVFKDRAKYVDGEMRFRRGYVGNVNPRKMVKQWAEKEFRNLKRLWTAGLRVPVPLELRGHVFAMAFLGNRDGSVAAPRLKDIDLQKLGFPEEDFTFAWRRLYIETLTLLREIFQTAHLVHGDFSEYNLLYHEGHVYVIDVSQSVEKDHPHALEFLKRDCANLNRFFTSRLGGLVHAGGFTGAEGKLDNTSDDHHCAPRDKEHGKQSATHSIDDVEAKKTALLLAVEATVKKHHLATKLSALDDSKTTTAFRMMTVQETFDYITKPANAFDGITEDSSAKWPFLDSHELHWLCQSANFSASSRPVAKQVPGAKQQESLSDYNSQAARMAAEIEAGKRAQWEQFGTKCLLTGRLLQQLVCIDGREEDDAAFISTWTPSNLHQLVPPLDANAARKEDAIKALAFLAAPQQQPHCSLSGVQVDEPEQTEDKRVDVEATVDDNESLSCASSDSPLDGVDTGDAGLVRFTGVIPEGIDRKVWKGMVKEQQRAKRQTKMPKKDKRRAVKKGKKKR